MAHNEDEVIEYLREVNDPELGINLVDLGLIRGVEVDERSVTVTYTLTTPACPLNEYIDAEMDEVLKRHMPDIQAVIPKLSWEPLWNPSMMSEDAKLELGFF
jgi:metal-sulfur cluster biosynthetic enzyme